MGGTTDRPYGHCIVAGIMKYPLKITNSMPEKKVAKRSRIKPFIKCVNYNHLMPTRYSSDIELKSTVTADVVSGTNTSARQNCRNDVKKLFEEKCARTLPSPKLAQPTLREVDSSATPSHRICA